LLQFFPLSSTEAVSQDALQVSNPGAAHNQNEKISSVLQPGQELTAQQKLLLDLLRLPGVPLDFQWNYQPSDFDELWWGDRAEKTAARKKKLAEMDRSKAPEAYADASLETARLLSESGKRNDAEVFRRKAEALYQSLVKKDPKSARLLYKTGMSQSLSDKTEVSSQAINSFHSALKADPGFCLPYLELIHSDRSNPGWLEEAEQCFLRRFEQQERPAEDYYNYHRFLHSRGVFELIDAQAASLQNVQGFDVKKAMEQFTSDLHISLLQKAVELDPRNEKYRGSLGALQVGRIFVNVMNTMSRMQQTATPAEAFNRASQVTHENMKDWYREAEENLAYVDKNKRNVFPSLFAHRAILAMMDDRAEMGEQNLVKAISLDPAADAYYQMLLYLYWLMTPDKTRQQEGFDRAAELLLKKCETKCSLVERRVIARIRFDAGKYGDAEKELRAALQRHPSSLPVRTGLAVTLLKMQRSEEAIAEVNAGQEFYEKADSEDKAHFWSLIAVLRLLEGNENLAAESLRKSLEINPNDPVAGALVRQ
jgi:hypothetical protein